LGIVGAMNKRNSSIQMIECDYTLDLEPSLSSGTTTLAVRYIMH